MTLEHSLATGKQFRCPKITRCISCLGEILPTILRDCVVGYLEIESACSPRSGIFLLIMKKCPYCAEEIQDEAIKCKHCGEFLNGHRPPQIPMSHGSALPWYFKTSFMVITFLTVPPFVLPSIWMHPKLNVVWKLVITVGVLGVCWLSYLSIVKFMHQFDELNDMMKNMAI